MSITNVKVFTDDGNPQGPKRELTKEEINAIADKANPGRSNHTGYNHSLFNLQPRNSLGTQMCQRDALQMCIVSEEKKPKKRMELPTYFTNEAAISRHKAQSAFSIHPEIIKKQKLDSEKPVPFTIGSKDYNAVVARERKTIRDLLYTPAGKAKHKSQTYKASNKTNKGGRKTRHKTRRKKRRKTRRKKRRKKSKKKDLIKFLFYTNETQRN